jgi:hypothetical protein
MEEDERWRWWAMKMVSDENDEPWRWSMKSEDKRRRWRWEMKMEMEMSEGRRWAKGYPIVLVTGSTVVCRKQLLVGKGPSSKIRGPFRESGEFIISPEK